MTAKNLENNQKVNVEENNFLAMKDRKNLPIILTVTFIALILFTLFIWPTFYVKKNINMGIFGTQIIRIHRLTGKTEIHSNGKWQQIKFSKDGTVSIPGGTQLEVR